MLSDRRNTRAAHRFLGKALKTMRNWPPVSITTDKLGSYRKAIQRLQRDGRLSEDVDAPNVEIPEQHHRSRPRRAEAGDPADTWVPDDEDSLRDHQRFRDHADDPSRALHSSRAGRCRRGPLRQQALRSARITAPLTWLKRVQRELMQQSPRRRNSSGRRAEPGDRSHHLLEPKLPGRYRPAHAGPGQPVRTRCCPAHRHSPGNTSASPATSCRTGPGTLP